MSSLVGGMSPTTDPASHAVYDALQLSASRPEVRILEILAGDGSDPLNCRLFTSSLVSGVAYSALSYTWETAAPLRDICLNGQEFPVRQNLYGALARIRRPSSAARLWVDAICINQDSVSERNSQVPLMRDIYSRASEVYIWLGEGSDDASHAMDALHRLSAMRHDDSEWQLADLQILLPSDMRASAFPEEVRDERMRSVRAGLNDIFTRPWFDRTWTIQELALARACPVVLCGSSSICWECFHATTDELAKYLRACNINDELSDYWVLSGVLSAASSHRADALSELRSHAQTAGQLRHQEASHSYLGRILSHTQYALCTDPRDKIYGVLGLVEPEAAEALTVDYTMSVMDVYMRTTMYLVEKDGFHILSSQGIWPRQDGWPSWVVDFRRSLPKFYTPLMRPYGDSGGPRYFTLPCGSHDPVARFVLARMVLQVHGIVVDRVCETSHPFKLTEENSASGKHKLELAAGMLGMFLRAGKVSGQSASDHAGDHPSYSPRNRPEVLPLGAAVLRTLIAGWVEPTYRHLSKPPGPPSDDDMEALRRLVRDIAEDAAPLVAMGLVPKDAEDQDPEASDIETKQTAAMGERVMKALNKRKAFRTDAGWIGTGPDDTKDGDYVVAVLGADVPFIFRIERDYFLLVGECYVEGIMFGELLENPHFRPDGDMDRPITLFPLELH